MGSAVVRAYERGDVGAFDAEVEAIGVRAMLEALLATASEEERALARACVPEASGPYVRARLDAPKLIALGAVGLWEATRWALEAIPRHEVRAPSPIHEQWDAILGTAAHRIEAPWLPIELLASLSSAQRPLGRRIVIGLERRFGARARTIAAARLRLGSGPLDDLLAAVAAPR